MATLVRLNLDAGTMTRYEVGGSSVRKTHFYAHDKMVEGFTPEVIEFFRLTPPEEFRLQPDPTPTPPNAGAGTARIAA